MIGQGAMPLTNAALGAAGIAAAAGVGYWLGGWNAAVAGFAGFTIGGFVASRQILWKIQAMREGRR